MVLRIVELSACSIGDSADNLTTSLARPEIRLTFTRAWSPPRMPMSGNLDVLNPLEAAVTE
jgi:hypothetical protein